MKVSQEISALCCSERPLRRLTASAFNTHVARRCLHANDITRDAPCAMCKTQHQLSPASSISADTDHIQRKWETWPSNSGRFSASSRVFPLECQGKMVPQRHLHLPLFYVHRHQPLLGDSSSAVPPSSRKRCECCPSIPAFRSFSRRAVFTGVHFTSHSNSVSAYSCLSGNSVTVNKANSPSPITFSLFPGTCDWQRSNYFGEVAWAVETFATPWTERHITRAWRLTTRPVPRIKCADVS